MFVSGKLGSGISNQALRSTYGPHPGRVSQCSIADGLFHSKGFNVAVAKQIIEAVAVRLV